ncbi:DUF1266 domain-containing protein [Streptomyces griseus]|uniref:DUF1266 domain-containing protein n=1 Tax=Streptomyces sp. CMC78 TaxID=3231512 RepID=A0AB33KL23_9ACTN|nr:DUF1266 domain-containing protein [Streptomyces sp. ID01-9D]MDX5577420.1 DUF1266 domain-containing protein [Streptomyces sp. ID01-9D]
MTTGNGAGTESGGAVAPTGIERALAAAVAGGSAEAVVEVLARTRLYVLVARLHADIPGWTAPLPTIRDEATRRTCVPVLTPGVLPPWHPEWVFRAVSLGELARTWPFDVRRLAVNHGTPFAVTVDARPKHLKAWLKADEHSGGPEHGVLLTDDGGPLHGPLAHGLALGAHLAVTNGLIWNRLGAVYEDYATDRARLRSPWGVPHRAEYRDRLASLMKNQLVGRAQEAVLRTRHTLAARLGRTPTREEWSEAVARAVAARDAGDRALAERSLHHVARYEDRLRADGALAPDGRVDTLAAFDLGRAVNVVRLALGARYGDPHEAEQDVLRLGELAQGAYSSWADFSLGYLMARIVHRAEDDGPEAAESTYRQSLAEHRTLLQDPTSPYRNIAWS